MSNGVDDPAAQWLERAREYWRARGSRLTTVRQIVCEVAVAQKEPFDAETLLRACRERDGLVSPASVYRTLNGLVEGGLLTELEGIEDRRVFAVRHGDAVGESTVVCMDCNKVIPVPNPCLALRESAPAREMGFSPKRLSLRVDSACDELRETGSCTRGRKNGQSG